jgi:hypothetical protein
MGEVAWTATRSRCHQLAHASLSQTARKTSKDTRYSHACNGGCSVTLKALESDPRMMFLCCGKNTCSAFALFFNGTTRTTKLFYNVAFKDVSNLKLLSKRRFEMLLLCCFTRTSWWLVGTQLGHIDKSRGRTLCCTSQETHARGSVWGACLPAVLRRFL